MRRRTRNVERLVAENVNETVWLRLRRLTSANLARHAISERSPGLPPHVLAAKAGGVASAVRSSLGYWQTSPSTLNARLLSRYYAVLQASIAEQVASPEVTATLEDVQRHTEQGHGLFTVDDPGREFPHGYLIGALRGGHFNAYCRHLGLNLTDHAFERRPRDVAKMSPDDRAKAVPLADLLRRVPELQQTIEESLQVPPLSFQIGHAEKNMSIASDRTKRHIAKTGSFTLMAPPEGPVTTTYAALYPVSESTTQEYLAGLKLPFENIVQEQGRNESKPYFVGEVRHPSDQLWWDQFEQYKSGYCGTSVIVPFWGTRDPFILHLVILYAASIVVRYLPSLWYRVEDGELNHVRALLEHYLTIVDNVLPKIVVERITGKELRIVQPGSFNAPI